MSYTKSVNSVLKTSVVDNGLHEGNDVIFGSEHSRPSFPMYAKKGMGALPEEPHWTQVNCGNAWEWFDYIVKNANSMKTSPAAQIFAACFLEWVWQQGIKARSANKIKLLPAKIGGNTEEFSFCLCEARQPDNSIKLPMVAKFGARGQGWQEMEIAGPPCSIMSGDTRTYYQVGRIYGTRKWAENPDDSLKAIWWDSDMLVNIVSHYGLFSVSPIQTYDWMKVCSPCGTGGGSTLKCVAPCRDNGKGNCVKDCAGGVIPCDFPCEVVKKPCMKDCNGKQIPCEQNCINKPDGGTMTTDKPCNCKDVTSKIPLYFTKTQVANSVPVKITRKVTKCTPVAGKKVVHWDCEADKARLQTELNSMKGMGAIPNMVGSAKTGALTSAAGTSQPCPTNCVEALVESTYYMSETPSDGAVQFNLDVTETICEPIEEAGNLSVDCNEVLAALKAKGYNLSGLSGCDGFVKNASYGFGKASHRALSQETAQPSTPRVHGLAGCGSCGMADGEPGKFVIQPWMKYTAGALVVGGIIWYVVKK